MEGWRREMYADADRPAVGDAVAEHADARHRHRLSGHGAVRRHDVSEGRGTTRPFELVGAPWIEAERFARDMNALELPGVYFRPAVFEPTFQKHAKQTCGGCQIHVTDRAAFQARARRRRADRDVPPGRSRRRFAWRQPPYEYEHDKMPIDILAGSDTLRQQIESGMPARDDRRELERDEESVPSSFAAAVPACTEHRTLKQARYEPGDSDQDRVFAIPGAFISCAVGGSR